jgi:hypothetical protein
MITKPQVRTNIYGAFYRVIRIGTMPTVDDFYASKVSDTMPKNQATPADFPDFWWEAVALEIQNGFIARKAFLNDLDAAWLKEHLNNTWQDILDFALDNVEALGETLG